MKNKHFYAHLTETTDIVLELGELDMSSEERVHLLSLIEANIHSAVINTVLSNLDGENKKIFLSNLISDDNSKTWGHLNKSAVDLENKIKITIDLMKKELLRDIKKARNQKAENK